MNTEKSINKNSASATVDVNKKPMRNGSKTSAAKKRLATLSRWAHIYLSMISFSILLFFAVTGLFLNHAEWFTTKEQIIKEQGKLNINWVNLIDTAKINKLQIVEYFRNQKDVKGAMSDFRIEEQEISLSFKGPGYFADSFIDRYTGKYELSVTRLGAVAVMNDLHKGRDSGKAWSWVIDVSAVLMTLVSISGIILICFIKKKRLNGFLILLIGTLVCYLIWKLFVP